MVAPLSSLSNMEMQLYGGRNYNASAPSYSNNYCGASNYNNSIFSNPYFGGYNMGYVPNNYNMQQYGTNFGQTIPQGYINTNIYNTSSTNSQQSIQANESATALPFSGLSSSEKQALVNIYAKNLEPSESFKNAALMGGISATIMQNPRIIAHPINYLTTTLGNSDVRAMFKDVKLEGSILNKAWKNNSMILEEAFSQMHRAEARSKWKIGLFRKRYTPEQYKKLKEIMETALKTGKPEEIAKATETLRHAYCQNGWLRQGFNKITKLFGKETLPSVEKNLLDTTRISENTSNLLKYQNSKMTLGKAFAKTGGIMGALMGLVEIATNWNKVTLAQEKDAENAKLGIKTEYGKQQKKQTITKAIANTVGWCAGETLSVLAWSKVGATVGTALGPGIGTAIGAAVGFIGGSIGMWLAGKAAKKAVGEDVSNKIQAEKALQTTEGQQMIVQDIAGRIQAGEKVDAQTQQALEKLMNMYA